MLTTSRFSRLAASAAIFALFLSSSCTDDTGPVTVQTAQLAIMPSFGRLQTGIVDIARGRFVLRQIPSGTVAADTVIGIPPDADSVALGIRVPVLTPDETFNLTIRLIASNGDTVFAGGPIEVSLTTSGTPVPVEVPFTYVGTGYSAERVIINSPDTSTFTGESVLLTAAAVDSNDTPIPGTPIGWTSLDTARVRITTDAQYRGVAVGGSQRGVARIVATLVTGQTDTVLVGNQPLPTALVAESGGGQSGRADSTLPQPLVARVTAADGLGVPGLWARFVVTSGGGTLSADSVRTDSTGRASVTWTLARSFQPNVVTATTARLGSASAVFNATLAFEQPATLEITAGDGQTAAAGTAIAVAPQVRVRDAQGLPVPGVTVTFAVTGGGGIVAGGTPVTDTLGLASVTSWTLGTTPGFNTLTATVDALTVTFNATGIAGPATRLAFTGEPSTVAQDSIIQPPVAVTAYDAFDNVATGFAAAVEVALLANPGGAVLGGSTDLSAYAGVASFGDLTLSAAGVGYTLLATSSGLTPDTSAAFDVVTTATSWDATADFSIVRNPNGQWSSGWTATPGSAFTLYTSASTGGSIIGWTDPAIVNLGTPSFSKNVSASTVNGVPPGMATLHPGCNALEYSELRWTAPGDGTYLANARFFAGDGGNTDAAVLVNGGTPVFSVASTGTNPSYSSFLTLSAGDRLQFTVGTGADGCLYDNTPIVVTVLATGSLTLTANSATTQTGTAGTAVSQPPSVVVQDGDGNPVAGVTVTFQVTAGGGSVTAATQVTDQSGIATVGSWILGADPGSNTVTASLPGVSAITFEAIATVRQVHWINADGGDWETAANWDVGRVPGAADTVTIDLAGSYVVTLGSTTAVAHLQVGGGGSTPTLRLAATAVASLTVADGLTNAGTIELTDLGYPNPVAAIAVTAGTMLNTGTIVSGAVWGGGRTITATIDNQGTIVATANSLTIQNAGRTFTTTSGALNVGAGQTLALNGGSVVFGSGTGIVGDGTVSLPARTGLTLASDFTLAAGNYQLILAGPSAGISINGPGVLTVADTLDIGSDTVNAPLVVQGLVETNYDAWVNGALTVSPSGLLRVIPIAVGTLTVANGFTNAGTIEITDLGFPNPVSTLAVTSGPVVNRGTIVSSAAWGGARIINASLEHRGLLSLSTPLTITGQLIVPSGAGDVGVEGNGAALTVAGLDVSWLYFANTPLISTGGTITRFDNVRFDNMAPDAVQLTINHPGAATPLTFTGLWFRVTPTTGRYIRANDTNTGDGNPLTIDLVSATPPDGSAYEDELNGAVINWIVLPGVNEWLPASGVWSDDSRWSLGRAPIPGDTVRIIAAGGGGGYVVTMDVDATAAKLRLGAPAEIVTLDASSHGLLITDAGPDAGLEILPFGSLVLQESGLVAERLTNEGTIRAGGSLIQSSAFTNLGTLNVLWGELVVSHPTSYDLQTSGTVLVEDGARLTLNGNGGLTYLGGTIAGGAAGTGLIRLLLNVPLVLGANLTYDNLIVESYDGSVLPQVAQQLTVGQFAQFRAMGTLTQILAPITVNGIVDIQSGDVRIGATAALNSTGTLRGVGSLDVTGMTGAGALAGSINPGDQPGGAAGVLTWIGDFGPDPGAVLNIDIGGYQPGTDHDQFDVQGAADLDGTLRVTLQNGFTPTAGDRFPVMTFTGAAFGFATLDFPDLGTLQLDTLTVDGGTNPDTLYLVASVVAAPIVFAGDSAGSSVGVLRVESDGSYLTLLASTGSNSYLYPRSSPDRSRVLFSQNPSDYFHELWVVSSDGTSSVSMVSDTTTFGARYSPDGVHVAFTCGDLSGFPRQDVCVIADASGTVASLAGIGNGSGKVFVTDAADASLSGYGAFAWNPQNPDQLAVVVDSTAGSRIWLVDFDGGNPSPLTSGVLRLGGTAPLLVQRMDWSPDGSFIVVEARNLSMGELAIFRVDVSDGTITQLTTPGVGGPADIGPVISPDNSEVLFARGGVLMRVPAGGGQAVAISPALSTGGDPGWDWSPDGSEIVHVTDQIVLGSWIIAKINATTTSDSYASDLVVVGRQSTVNGEIHDAYPSWRP